METVYNVVYVLVIIALIYVVFYIRRLQREYLELLNKPSKWRLCTTPGDENLENCSVLCTECGFIHKVSMEIEDLGNDRKIIIKAPQYCPSCMHTMSDHFLYVHYEKDRNVNEIN